MLSALRFRMILAVAGKVTSLTAVVSARSTAVGIFIALIVTARAAGGLVVVAGAVIVIGLAASTGGVVVAIAGGVAVYIAISVRMVFTVAQEFAADRTGGVVAGAFVVVFYAAFSLAVVAAVADDAVLAAISLTVTLFTGVVLAGQECSMVSFLTCVVAAIQAL